MSRPFQRFLSRTAAVCLSPTFSTTPLVHRYWSCNATLLQSHEMGKSIHAVGLAVTPFTTVFVLSQTSVREEGKWMIAVPLRGRLDVTDDKLGGVGVAVDLGR